MKLKKRSGVRVNLLPVLKCDLTFFIDRNTGGKALRASLALAGMKIVLHDELFPQNTADEAWIKSVSDSGFIVITGDKDVTHRLAFLKRARDASARVFILIGLNSATGPDRAVYILKCVPRIQQLLAACQPPCIWKIGEDAKVANRCGHDEIIRKLCLRAGIPAA